MENRSNFETVMWYVFIIAFWSVVGGVSACISTVNGW